VGIDAYFIKIAVATRNMVSLLAAILAIAMTLAKPSYLAPVELQYFVIWNSPLVETPIG
jgi:hypothetical protein